MKELSVITKKQVSTSSFLILITSFAFLLIAIFWPLASVWALNTLFHFNIPFTFWTWLAAWVLIMTFQGVINISKKRVK